MATRNVRRARTITVGADKYRVGKKATRTVAKTDTTKTVTLQKKSGGPITKTLTKSADAKNTRVGAYARAHATQNADGSTTYAKKGGGTVTKTVAVAADTKKKKKRGTTTSTGTSSTGTGTTHTPNGS